MMPSSLAKKFQPDIKIALSVQDANSLCCVVNCAHLAA